MTPHTHARIRLRFLGLAALAVALTVACGAPPGEQVATRIRAAESDLVQQVNSRPENFLDPAVIDVYLRPGATKAQALDFWCAVVIPAGGLSAESSGKAVGLWISTGEFMVPDVSCPGPSPK